MQTLEFFKYLAVMALVTYAIRMLPLVLFKKKITNLFVKSFLYYVPYAVLGAMTFPAIFYSTNSFIPALAGTIIAILLSWFNKSLITVAISASIMVLIFELII